MDSSRFFGDGRSSSVDDDITTSNSLNSPMERLPLGAPNEISTLMNVLNSLMEQLPPEAFNDSGASTDISGLIHVLEPWMERSAAGTTRSAALPSSSGAGPRSTLPPTLTIEYSDNRQRRRVISHGDDEQPLQFEGEPIQMIRPEGTFDQTKVQNFIEESETLSAPGAPYAVVSIIGAQSSGKSFLLNRLFGTNFEVMNAENGRMQITEGIWLSRCIRPCMLIMDVEGYDGRERAEDNRAFERQTALLALTISDLMMVNMWLHDVGRVEGGSVPLLRTLFQERAKLGPGRTKVLVVIRGYDYKTPFEILEKDVVRSMEQLWESIHYQSGQQIVQFSAYIEVLVVALPDAVLQETRFEEEVTKLRNCFAKSDLAGYRQDKVSARGFSFSVKKIWQTIRNNRRLDIPTHRMMVSIVFCERSAEDSLNLLESHEDYLSLKSGTEITPMEFSKKLENLMDCILFRYDQETLLYEAHVRNLKRQVLEADILNAHCWGLLQKLYSAASTERRAEITYQLSNAADPAMLVDELVEERLQMFVESCEGLSVRYQDLCDKTCEMLREVLTTFARAQSMKDLRIIKKDVKESDEDQRRDAMHRFQSLREEFEQVNEARAQDSRGFMYILSAVAPVLLPALIAIISAVISRRTR